MGERGGDVEEGLGGQGALDPPLASPQNPSVLLIISRTHLPPVSVHLICKLCSHTGLDQMRGCSKIQSLSSPSDQVVCKHGKMCIS